MLGHAIRSSKACSLLIKNNVYGMPMVTDCAEPEFWYLRAEKLRARAEHFMFSHPRAIMLRLAAHYDSLGDQVAERIAGSVRENERVEE
jgi:hypothetical protein